MQDGVSQNFQTCFTPKEHSSQHSWHTPFRSSQSNGVRWWIPKTFTLIWVIPQGKEQWSYLWSRNSPMWYGAKHKDGTTPCRVHTPHRGNQVHIDSVNANYSIKIHLYPMNANYNIQIHIDQVKANYNIQIHTDLLDVNYYIQIHNELVDVITTNRCKNLKRRLSMLTYQGNSFTLEDKS